MAPYMLGEEVEEVQDMGHMGVQKLEEQRAPEVEERAAMVRENMSKAMIHIIIKPKMEAMDLPIPVGAEAELAGNTGHNTVLKKGAMGDPVLYY